MAFGVAVFLIPSKIAAGGISGIATILQNKWGIKASLTVLVLNVPLLISAFIYCGKTFFFKTLAGALLLSLFLEIFSLVPRLINDTMLSAISGGLITGIGQGMVFRADASTGGTDIAAHLLKKIKPHLPISTLILIADGLVILASGLAFKNIETMVYASIALFITSKVIDGIVVGLDYAKEVTIISKSAPDISREIIKNLERGVTGVKCIGLYSGKENMMLVSVIKRNQIVKIKNIVQKYDKNAFVIVSEVKEVIGEGFK